MVVKMHGGRPGRQQARQRITVSLWTVFILSVLFTFLFYVYACQMRDFYGQYEESAHRCMSELTNVKYQLSSVSEYKRKMDTILHELQVDLDIQKGSLKDFSQNYLVIKHHMTTCENQIIQLQAQCKEIKAKLDAKEQELASCKNPG